MRFDSRGIGDSEGTFRRFSALQDDIAAAIDEFKNRAPHVRKVILWGGCDAATTALINAYKFPDVVCVIAGNPFVSSPATANKATRKHYRSRLLQLSFWKKVIKMEYDFGKYAAAALSKLRGKEAVHSGNKPKQQTGDGSGNFLNELLNGVLKFNGKVLFLMGDRFLTSDEFDSLTNSSKEWRTAFGKSNHERIDIKGGDQVFSSTEAQELMFDVASEWIHRNFVEDLQFKSSSNRNQAEQAPSEQTSI